jgi:ribonuclease-3
LDFIVSEYLYKKYPNLPEGDLSKLRASIVCEASLAVAAKNMGLGEFIQLGHGEELTGGRQRLSILADTFEAITGAMFLDGCFEKVRTFLEKSLIATISHLSAEDLYTDYKTLLQEQVQQGSSVPLHYEVLEEKGPDHDKDFYVAVYHDGVCLGKGSGKSKKEAEQQAAKNALKKAH